MNKKTIRDVDLAGKRVLVRVDFNVPLDGQQVTDDTRIRAAIPTLKYILKQKPAAVILMSHLGRPKGKPAPEYSLAPVVPVLSEQLGKDVKFVEAAVGEAVDRDIKNLPSGGVLLLENTRFNPGETDNDPEFSAALAKHGDIFVNDAFGSSHRAHASTVGITDYLPAVAGLLLEKEIDYLSDAVANPERPFVAILGGAKVSDKIGVIEALLGKVDKLLIGGGMANTFLSAQGIEMGNSLVEEEVVETAKSLAEKGGDKIVLPLDAVIADAFDNNANRKTIPVSDHIPEGWSVYDIGEKTVEVFQMHLKNARTVVWNGPMGVFEMPNFAKGTFAIAKILAEQAQNGATVIIGGGDSAAAVAESGLADLITHISTGGGASLEMLEGKSLPGVEALQDNRIKSV
jgi:phosphoglycerate kinase